MLIKKFSIIDYKNKEAASFSFTENINLIASKDNTMGKSSLLKSLYHTLGFQIKQFPSKWNIKDMFFQVEITINKVKYTISRQNNIFKINNTNNPLNEREFSDWLQKKLNINMELPNIRTQQLSSAYSSAIILPFYIDQDDSWDGIMYRRVSNAVGQYSNIPRTIFEYLFNLSNVEIQKLQNELNDYIDQQKKLKLSIDSLQRVIDKYEKEVQRVPSINKKALNKEIDYYLDLLNDYNNQVIKYKVKLINKKLILDEQKQELAELDELLKLNRKRIREIAVTCNYCHSHLTDEQSLTRFNLNNNEFEIIYLRDEVYQNITKLKIDIDKTHVDKQSLLNEVERIEKIISKSKKLLTIDEYVDAKAKTIAGKEMNDFIHKEIIDKEIMDTNIKETRKEIKDLKKEKKELNDKLKTVYFNELNKIKSIIFNLNVEELDFLSFKTIEGSGMDKNKKFLAYYLVYMRLIDEYGTYKIPFCMDSFIKNEISDESAKEMFGAIEQYLFKSNNQVFFSLVEQNKKHFEYINKYNIINVGPKILSNQNYDAVNKDIVK
ncbi:MAG TPA: hypothetical protein VFF20_04345 [Pseudogracilibacillus sp.]|nr:hypothetical protein [Pseudogracilibacillus sp.]